VGFFGVVELDGEDEEELEEEEEKEEEEEEEEEDMAGDGEVGTAELSASITTT